jgi:exodeoxyribonuclease-3
VPQGNAVLSEKYAHKLAWFRKLREYFETRLDAGKPAIWTGDVNVAPEPMDVYHPEKRGNDPDFHIDARNVYKDVVGWGFVDVFRQLHPEVIQYTYWDYFRNAVERNFGWRIDHILATAPLAKTCSRAEVDMGPRLVKGASDHTVVWAEFE